MAENALHSGCFHITNTDVVPICVSASLVVSFALITILAFHYKIAFITTQIFYITVKNTVNAGNTFTNQIPKEMPRVT